MEPLYIEGVSKILHDISMRNTALANPNCFNLIRQSVENYVRAVRRGGFEPTFFVAIDSSHTHNGKRSKNLERDHRLGLISRNRDFVTTSDFGFPRRSDLIASILMNLGERVIMCTHGSQNDTIASFAQNTNTTILSRRESSTIFTDRRYRICNRWKIINGRLVLQNILNPGDGLHPDLNKRKEIDLNLMNQQVLNHGLDHCQLVDVVLHGIYVGLITTPPAILRRYPNVWERLIPLLRVTFTVHGAFDEREIVDLHYAELDEDFHPYFEHEELSIVDRNDDLLHSISDFVNRTRDVNDRRRIGLIARKVVSLYNQLYNLQRVDIQYKLIACILISQQLCSLIEGTCIVDVMDEVRQMLR